MRILQVCKKFPFPLKDGETIAINQLTRAFHQLGSKTFVTSLNTQKHKTDIASLPPVFLEQAKYSATDIDTSPRLSMLLRSIFKGSSFNIERFYSKDFELMLGQLCSANEFDIIQLEGLYLLNYIPVLRKNSKAKIVFRSHNIEHLIWKRLAEKEKEFGERLIYKFIARGLKKAEKEIAFKTDALVPISREDSEWFKANGYTGPMHLCPVALDAPPPQLIMKSKQDSITRFFHIGSMDWLPNQEGLYWFIENVWKNFVTTHTQAELHLAGRNFPPGKFTNLRNVVIHGEVEDALQFISNNDVMIVPLFSGSGMRIKIIEAMNLAKTVITTSIGKEGIDAVDDENILLADSAADFLLEMDLCVQNKVLVENIGKKAADFIRKEFDTFVVGKQLLDFYEKL